MLYCVPRNDNIWGSHCSDQVNFNICTLMEKFHLILTTPIRLKWSFPNRPQFWLPIKIWFVLISIDQWIHKLLSRYEIVITRISPIPVALLNTTYWVKFLTDNNVTCQMEPNGTKSNNNVNEQRGKYKIDTCYLICSQ